jgi:FkbM family methyltransferase
MNAFEFLARIPLRIKGRLRRSKRIAKGSDAHSLYKTKFGDFFWLKTGQYVDDCIIRKGIFEPDGTKIAKTFIKDGDVILDIGANIGYYSVLFSRLVGKSGRVLAFEPTKKFQRLLQRNLEANSIKNVIVFAHGLSDRNCESTINVGIDTATMHFPGNNPENAEETIRLETLGAFVAREKMTKIDFVKIDVDGHEPAILAGAWEVLEKFKPLVFLEVNHLNYFTAGVPAWDFFFELQRRGLHIYSEKSLLPLTTVEEFLIECGNFAYSANILLSFGPLDSKQRASK